MPKLTIETPVRAIEGGQEFLNAERLVEVQSGELKKELRLGDLVLSQVLYIMAFSWLGPAAKIGATHVVAWIPAVLCFYIPSGIVVLHLNREMPLEGGLYQWAKLRFGAAAGYLVALNLLAMVMLILAGEPSAVSNNLSYLAGTGGSWIIENRAYTMLLGAVMIGGLTLVTLRGLVLGRWFHNVGGAILAILFVGMLLFAFPRWIGFGPAIASTPASFAFPAISLLNLTARSAAQSGLRDPSSR